MFAKAISFVFCVAIFTPAIASASEPPVESTVNPFQKTTVSGFDDNVDLYDESTWADLEPEEKDKLREIRAKKRTTVPGVQKNLSLLPVDDNELPPILKSSEASRSSRNQDWWYSRDNKLTNLTIGFGVTWGISVAATAIIWSVHAKNANQCDSEEDIVSDRCMNGVKQSLSLAPLGYITSSVAGISLLGTIVSGAVLGSHRNAKPFISASRNSIGIGFSGKIPSIKL